MTGGGEVGFEALCTAFMEEIAAIAATRPLSGVGGRYRGLRPQGRFAKIPRVQSNKGDAYDVHARFQRSGKIA